MIEIALNTAYDGVSLGPLINLINPKLLIYNRYDWDKPPLSIVIGSKTVVDTRVVMENLSLSLNKTFKSCYLQRVLVPCTDVITKVNSDAGKSIYLILNLTHVR